MRKKRRDKREHKSRLVSPKDVALHSGVWAKCPMCGGEGMLKHWLTEDKNTRRFFYMQCAYCKERSAESENRWKTYKLWLTPEDREKFDATRTEMNPKIRYDVADEQGLPVKGLNRRVVHFLRYSIRSNRRIMPNGTGFICEPCHIGQKLFQPMVGSGVLEGDTQIGWKVVDKFSTLILNYKV